MITEAHDRGLEAPAPPTAQPLRRRQHPRTERSRTRLRRRREDRTSVAVVAVACGAQLAVVAADLWWLGLLLVPFVTRWVGLVLHNHVHSRVFTARRWNRAFDRVLLLITGMPPILYRHHHVRVHH